MIGNQSKVHFSLYLNEAIAFTNSMHSSELNRLNVETHCIMNKITQLNSIDSQPEIVNKTNCSRSHMHNKSTDNNMLKHTISSKSARSHRLGNPGSAISFSTAASTATHS